MRKGIAGGALVVLLAAGAFIGSRGGVTAVAGPGVCDLTLGVPAPDRANAVYLRSSDSLMLTVSGKSLRCLNATVTLVVSENGGAESSLGTATTDSTTGAWSKSITVTDAVSSLVSARMTGGGRTTQATRTFLANTGLPKLAVAAPAANDFGVLKVVAAHPSLACGGGGNAHVFAGEPGWVADTSCADGGQVATSVVVTGANPGYFSVTYNGVEVYDSGISSSPQTFTPTITLPDVTRADLVFAATNDAGTTSTTYLTRVMTLNPPAVLGPDGGVNAFRSTVLDARAANVDVDFILPAIPTNVESASLDLQWTTSTLINGPDGGTRRSDGGTFRNDATLDIDVFVRGALASQGFNRAHSHHPTLGSSNGLVMEMPDECILYDPSVSPQIWECKDGRKQDAGTVYTAHFRGLPPLNSYFFWVLTKY